MYIKINDKKIKVHTLTKFWPRLKSYRFYLEPIKDGLCYPKKRCFNTYLFCQRVDIIMTDKENKIMYIYNHIKSEKIIFYKRKVYYTYILPVNTTKKLRIGETLSLPNS